MLAFRICSACGPSGRRTRLVGLLLLIGVFASSVMESGFDFVNNPQVIIEFFGPRIEKMSRTVGAIHPRGRVQVVRVQAAKVEAGNVDNQ